MSAYEGLKKLGRKLWALFWGGLIIIFVGPDLFCIDGDDMQPSFIGVKVRYSGEYTRFVMFKDLIRWVINEV